MAVDVEIVPNPSLLPILFPAIIMSTPPLSACHTSSKLVLFDLAVRPRLLPWRHPCVANCGEATVRMYVHCQLMILMHVCNFGIYCCAYC